MTRCTARAVGAIAALAIAAPAAAHASEPPDASPSAIRVDHGTLVVEGGTDGDTVALSPRRRRIEVDLGADGSADATIARRRFDRVRVSLGEGLDTLVLDGSAADEHIRVAAADERVRLVRDVGDLRVDVDDVEQIRVAAGDGEDSVTVGDLSATDAFQVDAELGDGLDTATVDASDESDQVSVSAFSGAVAVLGPTFVRLEHPEATDRLTVDGRRGDDIISASTAAMALTLDGGDGTNVISGGPGDDLLLGGDGFDDVRGGPGHDTARLGADFDRFSWAPGDGSEIVDGGASRDSLFVLGSNDAEAFGLQAAGRGLRLTRDRDDVVMGLARVEEIDTVAGGGADTFAVGDLSRTDAALVDISLSPGAGAAGGDGAGDRVTVQGTRRHDDITVAGKVVVAGTATVTGLPATVNVSHAEGTLDTLAIDARAGQDSVDTSALAPGTIGLEIVG
jgi:hypothetical protein